ncbi:unnamed protein product [Ectocarpus fasciculatus]
MNLCFLSSQVLVGVFPDWSNVKNHKAVFIPQRLVECSQVLAMFGRILDCIPRINVRQNRHTFECTLLNGGRRLAHHMKLEASTSMGNSRLPFLAWADAFTLSLCSCSNQDGTELGRAQ